jgi:hypothetical protein
MPKVDKHAPSRTREIRQKIAVEAARLISEHGIGDFHVARQRAAARLGVTDQAALPGRDEIEQALGEHQRLFVGQAQTDALLQRRRAALEAMRFFEQFEPRLVGAVLEGTADQQSAVCLQLFADPLESVGHFLDENGIPAEQLSRRLRLDRERLEYFTAYAFSADGLPFELIVLPRDALRQAPLDRLSDRPMRRASRSALQALLDSTD